MNKNTKIISGFPGVGKTYFCKNCKNLSVLDSDNSKFTKNDFPNNYIRHIKKNIGKVDIIMVSSHKEIREALTKNRIEFLCVIPSMELREEYKQRYIKRGNDKGFIDLIYNSWYKWLIEINENHKVHCLKSNEYINEDLINQLLLT